MALAAADAVDRLLEYRDPALLPLLREALGEEDRALRVRITTGILRSFPELAPNFFFALCDDPSEARKEAAVFAVGSLDDPRTLPMLLSLIDHKNATLSEAAARSLLNRGRQAVNSAYSRVTGGRSPHPEKLKKIFRDTARGVTEELLSTGREGELRRLLFQKYAGADAARRAREGFAKAHLDDPVAAKLMELGTRVATWTPRPSLPGPGTLHYSIHIQNVFVNSDRTVEIQVGDEDFRSLQYWSYFLDRAVRLELPIDHLLVDPELCSPRLTSESDTHTIHYRLPERTSLHVGVGILNIAYWSGAIEGARDVALVVDTKSGFPRSETVTDAEGVVQYVAEYLDPAEVRDGSFAPRLIRVAMPHAKIGARTLSMRYEFRFAIHEGVWRLDGGESYAIGAAGSDDDDPGTPPAGTEEIRAIVAVSNARWVPKTPERAKDPDETNAGGEGTSPKEGTNPGAKPTTRPSGS